MGNHRGHLFYYVLRKIIHHLPRNRKETVTSVSALILLAFAVTTPYLPRKQTLSGISPRDLRLQRLRASAGLSLILIVWKLYCMNREVYRPYFICLNIITVLSTMLLCLAGIVVNSALEIFFTVSCTLMLIRLYRRVSSSGTVTASEHKV